MLEKKNPRKNLEKKRWTFLLIGLTCSLGISLAAINWSSAEHGITIIDCSYPIFDDDETVISVTFPEPKPLPPPLPKIVEIEIVPDDTEIEIDLILSPVDIDEDEPVEIVEDDDFDLVDEIIPFIAVENLPIFPGCEDVAKEEQLACFHEKVMLDLNKKFKYPTMPKEMNVEEKILVTFDINKDGEIQNAKVAIGSDPDLKAEALRLIRSIPKMKPASQLGKPVSVRYTLPIDFKLR